MENNKKILSIVSDIREELPRVGTRKMLKDIQEFNDSRIGRDKLFSLLKVNVLLVKTKKSFTKTTYSNHSYAIAPNLVKQLTVEEVHQVLVGDITYIRLSGGKFCYLFLVTDYFSRKILGYHLAPDLTHYGALIALKMAVEQIGDPREIIFHSDRGVQYCCHEFMNEIRSLNMLQSMTDENHCYQNAIAERVNGILKDEFNLDNIFDDLLSARKIVDSAIWRYNNLRRHLSLKFLTPQDVYLMAV
jgi:putative transposase